MGTTATATGATALVTGDAEAGESRCRLQRCLKWWPGGT